MTTIVALVAPEKNSLRAYTSLSAVELGRCLPPAVPPPHPYLSALFSYSDPHVRGIVWEIKYRRHSALAEKMGALLCKKILSDLAAETHVGKHIILVPVSSSAARRRERGFNQCEVLCEAIVRAAAEHAPEIFCYEPHVLEKIKNTPHQADLARAERLQNIVGSYAVRDPEICRGEIICVVDDVITTGATLSEIRRTLLLAGAHNVRGFAIAH